LEKKRPREKWEKATETLRLIAPDTIEGRREISLGGGFRAGCAVLKKIELKEEVELEPQVMHLV
jgi:hypothetical protein